MLPPEGTGKIATGRLKLAEERRSFAKNCRSKSGVIIFLPFFVGKVWIFLLCLAVGLLACSHNAMEYRRRYCRSNERSLCTQTVAPAKARLK